MSVQRNAVVDALLISHSGLKVQLYSWSVDMIWMTTLTSRHVNGWMDGQTKLANYL